MRYREIIAEGANAEHHAAVARALALALHATTDLPLVALMVGKRSPKTVAHVMVESADDAFIDADGVHLFIENLDQ